MPKPPPNCRKCGLDHYRFVRCENAEGFAEQQQTKEKARSPHIVRVERPDGLRDWGDKLTTLTRLGGQSFGLSERTTPMQTGSLNGPPDWTPPEAA